MLVRIALACTLSLAFAGPAAAQWGSFIKDKLSQLGLSLGMKFEPGMVDFTGADASLLTR